MAPDLILNKNTSYTEKVDVWSLGTMYYELLVGHAPFIDRTQEGFSKKMSEGNYEFPAGLGISPEAMHFISRCLQFNEEDRAGIWELCDSPYVFDKKMNLEDPYQLSLSTTTSSVGTPSKGGKHISP